MVDFQDLCIFHRFIIHFSNVQTCLKVSSSGHLDIFALTVGYDSTDRVYYRFRYGNLFYSKTGLIHP